MAANEGRPTTVIPRPHAHQVDLTHRGMSRSTPTDELIETAESVCDQVGVTVIILGVSERNSDHRAGRHLGDHAARSQVITEGSLGDNDVNGSLG